ncbi:hypothetical protein D018_3847B, partial [Vibrio parahaemolyticus VP2007-007]
RKRHRFKSTHDHFAPRPRFGVHFQTIVVVPVEAIKNVLVTFVVTA